MLAMQYEIPLPADYDMGIIRHRVASRGAGTDGWPGLGYKAYLVRHQGVGGSRSNAYAPFYLWNTIEGMNEFLWGAGFRAILTDFGRPVVRQWSGLGYHHGPEFGTTPLAATKRVWQLSPDADPAAEISVALTRTRATADRPGTHSAALAVDPSRWQLVQLTLLTETPAEPAAETGVQHYQVLHLSQPGIDELPTGQHWG